MSQPLKPATKIISFAVLGIATGALGAAAIVFAGDIGGFPFYFVAPGLIFGVVFGTVLWLGRLLGPVRAAIYAVAAALSHAAAIFTALRLVGPLRDHFGLHDLPALIVCGVVAGALGGGLLTAVTRALAPIRPWPLPALAGALMGALLVAIDGGEPGLFAFYMLWQAGYAACLAFTLPRVEKP